jgi:hypothetical protein
LNIQREITPNTVIKIGYLGARGNNLPRMGEANPYVASLNNRINPNFGSTMVIVTDAQSFYNALQTSFEQRYSHGLAFQVVYTYSHSIDDSSGPFPSDAVNETGKAQDFFNRKMDRGRSGFDIRHNFTANFTWELPFGPGKALGADLKGVAAALIGGWQVNGIGSFHSNVPFTAVLGFDNAGTQSLFVSDRPDLVGDPYSGTCPNGARVGTVECWFNPRAFALPASGKFGNAGRNILRGPAFRNVDMALLKNFPWGESRSVEFRAEFFNIANHPNFAVPANTQGPNGTGGNGDAVFLGRDATGAGIRSGNTGAIFSTVNSSRQIQLGLKLIF